MASSLQQHGNLVHDRVEQIAVGSQQAAVDQLVHLAPGLVSQTPSANHGIHFRHQRVVGRRQDRVIFRTAENVEQFVPQHVAVRRWLPLTIENPRYVTESPRPRSWPTHGQPIGGRGQRTIRDTLTGFYGMSVTELENFSVVANRFSVADFAWIFKG